MQQNRALYDDRGVPFGLTLPDIVQSVPALSFSAGVSHRVSNLIRLNAEPTLYLLLSNPTRVGFGLTLGITFLFFT